MARRYTKRNVENTQTPVPAVEDSPEVTEPEAPVVVKPKPKDTVVAVIILGNGLVHPCGTRLFPNSPIEIPDDGWTRAQMAAGIMREG